MEQYIKKLLFKLGAELAAFFLLIIVVAALGVYNVIPNGVFAVQKDANTQYFINIAAIAVAFVATTAALWLFKLNTEQNIKRYTLEDATKTYHRWSLIRLVLIAIAVITGISAFFLTCDDTGLFIAAVLILITMIFCMPSFQKINEYLENSQKEKN